MAKCKECGEKKNPAEAKFCSKCGTALGAGASKSKKNVATSLGTQTEILSDFWLNYKNDEDFVDFVEYNDIGLPLAYIIANEIVEPTEQSERFIRETFTLLLEALEIEEDEGFESIDELLGANEDD